MSDAHRALDESVRPAGRRLSAYCWKPIWSESRGLFVAEGRLVVKRLIEDGRRFRSVLVNDTAYRGTSKPRRYELAQHVPVPSARRPDLVEVTGYDIHRGCACACRASDRADVGQSARRGHADSKEPHDRRDTGRRYQRPTTSAACSVTPPRSRPTPCSSVRLVAIRCIAKPFARRWPRRCAFRSARIEKWPDDLAQLRDRGFTIAALTPREPSVTLSEFSTALPSARLALLVGTEGPGLTTEAETAADVRVRIPIAPEVDSLNVAVAVGIALHSLCDASNGRASNT